MFYYDYCCRSVIYPVCMKSGAFSDEQAFHFSNKKEKKVYRLSVGSMFLLRNVDNAHEFGLAVARVANDRLAIDVQERSYLGFYEFSHGESMEIELRNSYAKIVWKVENDQDAHFEVLITAKNREVSNSKLNTDVVAFTSRLANIVHGPYRYNNTTAALDDEVVLPNKRPLRN